jgi:protein-tyrosine phosphatase/nicotinamidase-related amidase
MNMSKSILFTQCLQNDYVKPIGKYDPLPNLNHIGYEESKRLMGLNPAEGPVNYMMKWAYDQPEEELEIIHLRDWHDAKDPDQLTHLETIGTHCIAGTEGAKFAFYLDSYPRLATVLESRLLNDFIDTELPDVLEPFKNEKVRVGIMGVWTEAKVSFLAYDLASRYPNFEIAICSALTAGSSLSDHYHALDHLQKILGVRIIHSIGEFIKFLASDPSKTETELEVKANLPELSFDGEANVTEVDDQIIRYLFRHARKVNMKVLDGGYSGNLVLGAQSIDMEGREEAPHVMKIGPQEPIGQERMSFEKVEQVLGNSAPRITEFIDYKERGGIKYRYASMGKGNSTTFQKLYTSGIPLEKVKKFLDIVFVDQLGKFYNAKEFEKANLLEYYMYDPKRAERLKTRLEKVLEYPADGDYLKLPTGQEFLNPYVFYRDTVADLIARNNRSAFFAYTHGDLNGANIMIDGQENVWLIDFFHTHRGHVLRDLIKLENDLLYIYTPLESFDDMDEALILSDILFGIRDLARPLKAVEETGLTKPGFIRTYETLKILRSYYPKLIEHDRDPLQLLIGQQRYSLHTQMFFESNRIQKLWAMYNSGYYGTLMERRIKSGGQLRIDWIDHELVGPGAIGITILPGRKDYSRSIDDDIQQIKKYEIDIIIPLITDDEFHKFGVDDLLKEYDENGFEVHRLRIMDQLVSSKEEMQDLVKFMDAQILDGKKIMIHCVGGLGRSGMAAASYLKFKGLSADKAIEVIRETRGPRAVESEVQENFVREINFS